MLRGFMLLIIFYNPPKKEEDSRNRMGDSDQSSFQKVQRIHELEFLYASFMLLLRYYLCLFYTYYASTKKQCYVVLCFSVSFIPPQRRMMIFAIGWDVRFGQHLRRYIELMSLNFRILCLCYHYFLVYAVFKQIILEQRSLQISCVNLILWFYVF